VSLNLLFNYFIFRNIGGDLVRMTPGGIAVRPGLLVNYLRIGGGNFYLRGEKAFGQELLKWAVEAGWRCPSWAVFARGEDLNVLPSPRFDRVDYILGFKLFFSTAS